MFRGIVPLRALGVPRLIWSQRITPPQAQPPVLALNRARESESMQQDLLKAVLAREKCFED